MSVEQSDRGRATAGGAMRLVIVALALVLLTAPVASAVAAAGWTATLGDATTVANSTEGLTAANDGTDDGAGAIDSGGVLDTSGTDGGEDETRRTGAPLTECFVGEGYPLSIGNGSATIDAVVHASVLTDPAAGDEFGVELAGSIDEDPLVTLAAGVRFDAPGLLSTGVNPFAAFDLVYTYELRLPMFDGSIGDTEHREDSPPVGSAAGTVPC